MSKIEIRSKVSLKLTVRMNLGKHIKEYKSLKRSFIKSTENERLLLLANFTVKFEGVFVLTQENNFSKRFHYKANPKILGSYC